MSQLSDRSVSQLSDGSVSQLCVAAQFYLENKGKYIIDVWGRDNPKDMKRRERVKGEGEQARREIERQWEKDPGPLAPFF